MSGHALPPDSPRHVRERRRMLHALSSQVGDQRVLAAMEALPRHQFLPDDAQNLAYGDHPVPLPFGQTMSQPLMVALMLELLEVNAGDDVLDVGSGSGYAAALLAQLAGSTGMVHAVERLEVLQERSRVPLAAWTGGASAAPVVLHEVGEAIGVPDSAPYDRIHVACAGETIPSALIDQLATGGRMVIPVGSSSGPQRLLCINKSVDGVVSEKDCGPVRFVPLIKGL